MTRRVEQLSLGRIGQGTDAGGPDIEGNYGSHYSLYHLSKSSWVITSGFTTKRGFPPVREIRMSSMSRAGELLRAFAVVPAMWVVRVALSNLTKSLSGGRGSSGKTSSPAPAIAPSLSTAKRAAWSMRPAL